MLQGNKLSHLPAKFNKEKGVIEPESYLTNPKSQIYKNKPPVYNIEIFEDIGRATIISILDLEDDNPISRVTKSIYKDVVNMRLKISLHNNINVTQTKKKEELLRKRAKDQEKNQRIPQSRPSKRMVITPNTSQRINKMHRGHSCVAEIGWEIKEPQKEEIIKKNKGSSLSRHSKEFKNKNKLPK